MIRNTLTALLLVGFAGTVSAQGPQDVVTALNNVDGAVNNLVGNLQGTSVSLLSGDVTGTANGLNDSLTGLAVDLSANTPASPLGDVAVQVGDQLVAASAPLTTAMDGPAGQLAALGAPLAEPTIDAIEGVEFELSLEFVAPGLPGLPGGGGGLPLPGLGDLPGLGELPALPGLDGLPAIPGLDGGLPLPGLPA